jgi:hypothetical protein
MYHYECYANGNGLHKDFILLGKRYDEKLVPVRSMKGYNGSNSIALLILNLSVRQRRLVSFTP